MKKIVLASIFCLVSRLAFPSSAEAKVVIQEEGRLVIPATEVVDDDLFLGAENIDFDGSVTGNVYAGTGEFYFRGSIDGDLVLGTGKANLSGQIGGDLYVGAGDVNLTGATIGGSVISGAGNISIDDKSTIGGSLLAATGNLRNSATVARNLIVGAGNIYINSQVGKEARLGAGQIELGPQAKISGDLTYSLGEADSELKQDSAASIAGTVSRYTPPEQAKRDMQNAREQFGKVGVFAHRGWLFFTFLSSLLIGGFLLWLFPKTFAALANQLKSKTRSSLIAGFLVVLASFPVVIFLAITVLGLPLAITLLVILCLSLHLAKLISAFAFGRFLSNQFGWTKMGVYAVFFIGLLAFYILRLIPVFGWIASIIFTWAGLGSILLYAHSHRKSL